jgi:hypothetical protein
MGSRRQDYDYLIKLLLIGDSGKVLAAGSHDPRGALADCP